jgi:hypothetical protein
MAPRIPVSKPLTPTERRQLVEAPLPTFNIYGGRAWAGIGIADEEGHRRHTSGAVTWYEQFNQDLIEDE